MKSTHLIDEDDYFFVPTVLPVASRYVVPFPELVAVPAVLPVASRYVVRVPSLVAVPGPLCGSFYWKTSWKN